MRKKCKEYYHFDVYSKMKYKRPNRHYPSNEISMGKHCARPLRPTEVEIPTGFIDNLEKEIRDTYGQLAPGLSYLLFSCIDRWQITKQSAYISIIFKKEKRNLFPNRLEMNTGVKVGLSLIDVRKSTLVDVSPHYSLHLCLKMSCFFWTSLNYWTDCEQCGESDGDEYMH